MGRTPPFTHQPGHWVQGPAACGIQARATPFASSLDYAMDTSIVIMTLRYFSRIVGIPITPHDARLSSTAVILILESLVNPNYHACYRSNPAI
jgi:hypothetical protein